MIIGKDSVWKMLALFAMVLLAVMDIIFCSTKAVYIINALLVGGSLLAVAVKLFQRWSAES